MNANGNKLIGIGKGLTRRQCLTVLGTAAVSTVAFSRLGVASASGADAAVTTDPKVQGPFPILSTPYTATGEIDYDDLAREARFINSCGSSGMIWPQSGDSVDLLTKEEKMKGMEVLAKASQGMKTLLCLGVQGVDTADMLDYARHAESLAPGAIISRPPDSGKTVDDLRKYWRALAKVAQRPVIIQTTGKGKAATPSTDLLIELAREFPYFGYVKEEQAPIASRIQTLLSHRPPIRRVFSAMGGFGWLYEMRLGTEGVITERVAYIDLMVRIWDAHKRGQTDQARDLFDKFLLMTNLTHNLPGGLRGPHLYLLKKRGIFKTTVSREYPKKEGDAPVIKDLHLSPQEIAEIEYRFEALKPYLCPGQG